MKSQRKASLLFQLLLLVLVLAEVSEAGRRRPPRPSGGGGASSPPRTSGGGGGSSPSRPTRLGVTRRPWTTTPRPDNDDGSDSRTTRRWRPRFGKPYTGGSRVQTRFPRRRTTTMTMAPHTTTITTTRTTAPTTEAAKPTTTAGGMEEETQKKNRTIGGRVKAFVTGGATGALTGTIITGVADAGIRQIAPAAIVSTIHSAQHAQENALDIQKDVAINNKAVETAQINSDIQVQRNEDENASDIARETELNKVLQEREMNTADISIRREQEEAKVDVDKEVQINQIRKGDNKTEVVVEDNSDETSPFWPPQRRKREQHQRESPADIEVEKHRFKRQIGFGGTGAGGFGRGNFFGSGFGGGRFSVGTTRRGGVKLQDGGLELNERGEDQPTPCNYKPQGNIDDFYGIGGVHDPFNAFLGTGAGPYKMTHGLGSGRGEAAGLMGVVYEKLPANTNPDNWPKRSRCLEAWEEEERKAAEAVMNEEDEYDVSNGNYIEMNEAFDGIK